MFPHYRSCCLNVRYKFNYWIVIPAVSREVFVIGVSVSSLVLPDYQPPNCPLTLID